MPLRLITGCANTGKTGSIYADLVARSGPGHGALLLLPSAPDVSRALGALASDAPLGLTISTFDDFLHRLWAAHGDGRQIVSPVQRVALLAESARRTLDGDARSLGEQPGFLRTLAVVVQRAAEAQGYSARRTRDSSVGDRILRCAESYADALSAAAFVEGAEACRLLVGLLDDVELPDLVAASGFTGLTAAQEDFLVAAAAITDVVVALTYDAGVGATAAAEDLVARLRELGVEEHRCPEGEPRRPPELARIETTLGSQGGPDVPARGSLLLSEAWGEGAEAARIAREAQDAIADGIEPGAIAIVYRDVGPHLRELRSALDDAGILAEFDVQLPFHLAGLGRTLLMLLDFGGDGPEHKQLMDVLRSPFSPASDETVDALDARCRRWRTGGIGFARDWCAARHPGTAEFLRSARRAASDVAGPDAERRWYSLISDMLRRAHGGEATTDSDLLIDAAAARVFMDAVKGLAALPGCGATPQVLASVLRDASVTLSSTDRADRVQVMGAERVRGREYACVILGGLQAGEFPRRVVEDALSAPAVAQVLARHGIDVAPRSGTAQERLLFYQAVTRASERLVLSWQSHDADGHPLRPSIFLEEVLDLYRDPVTGEYFSGAPPLRVLGLDSLAEHPAAPSSDRRSARTLAGLPAIEAESAEVAEARRRASRARPAVSEGVRAVMADRDVFSASGIETYLQCPFRWYVQRLVQPRELDERLDTAARGRLAHEIMQRFYEAYAARGGEPRVTPETLDTAREIHAAVSAAVLADITLVSAAESVAARATARRTLRLVEADATLLPGMNPCFHEWAFGMDGDPPEPFGTFSLAGRVDRIDADASRLVVTDYKLGTIDGHHGALAFEEKKIVQLPLYAAVAARRLNRNVAGGIYRSVSGTKPRGFVHPDLAGPAFVKNDTADEARIQLILAEAIERASTAVEGMRAGAIPAEPRGGSCPAYCPARAFCAEWRS